MKRIYFAAPLFNEMELERNKKFAEYFRKNGFEVYLPQESGLSAKLIKKKNEIIPISKNLFELDKNAIKNCDILIFFLDGRVPDEGACVELGMAYAWGKRCLGYKTDDRSLDYTGTDNLFIEGCMNFKIFHNIEELSSELEVLKTC